MPSEARLVWLGEGDVASEEFQERITKMRARLDALSNCSIAILEVGSAQPTLLAMAECSAAIAAGRQTLLAASGGYVADDWGPPIIRATTHGVGHSDYITRDELADVASLIWEHSCGSRIGVAFPSELLEVARRAESPIEARLGLHLVQVFELDCDVHCQAPIQIGDKSYRADFLLSDSERPDLKIVVETDGHDFHERTKEQAARDKQRDRAMAIAGYHVLRFTGSEVFKNPAKCVEDVKTFADMKRGYGT
jgi:very-short-patch-repair endonuclease